MSKAMIYLIVFFFAFIMLSSTVVAFIPNAFSQVPTQQYVQKLEAEGKQRCEVFQINEFFYKPIRINMVHERVSETGVSIRSEDPESEVFWDASFQTFQMVTDSQDRFDVEVVLDYEVKHEEPRQIYYQIYAQDNVLMMEGNWVHEGFTFCKVFSFFAGEQPYVPTFDDIQEQNNKFNADFRKEVATSNTSLENGMITVAIVVLVVGIFVGVVFFLIIVSLKSMGRIGNKPVKKLDEMITLVRTVTENLKLVSDHLLRTDTNMIADIKKDINNVLADLSIVVQGLKTDYDKKTVIVKPKDKSTLPPATPETVESNLENMDDEIVNAVTSEFTESIDKPSSPEEPVPFEPIMPDQEKPNTPEQEAENEKIAEELLLGKQDEKPMEVTFVPSDLEDDLDKPSNPEEPVKFIPTETIITPKEEEGDAEVVSVNVTEVAIDKELIEKVEDKISYHPESKDITVDTISNSKSKEELDEEEKIISLDATEIKPCATCGAKPYAICGQCNKQFCENHQEHDCTPKKEDTDPVIDLAKKGGKALKQQFFDEKKPNLLDKDELEKRLEAGDDPSDLEDDLADEYFKTSRNDNLDLYGKLTKQERKNRTKANSIRVGAMLKTLNKQVIN